MQTPYYEYDIALLNSILSTAKEEAQRYGYKIHYALKANSNHILLKEIARQGFGADCVSANEIRVALENGFPANSIVFAGVGKSDSELEYAISKDIECINCESVQELEVINQIASSQGKVPRVALRVNPNVDAKTHRLITTGLKENKFGISLEEAEWVFANKNNFNHINFVGLHFHIGSQILNLEVFKQLAIEVNRIQKSLGTISMPYLNLGGGLGIDYENPLENPVPNFEGFFRTVNEYLMPGENQTIHFELGRSLVGQCGKLYTSVLYVKESSSKRFAIVDAGMNALIRPALYGASHRIENVSGGKGDELFSYDVVGPICETSDCFAEDATLPKTSRGDILVIHSCGAYAESMASDYNLRERPRSVYVGLEVLA